MTTMIALEHLQESISSSPISAAGTATTFDRLSFPSSLKYDNITTAAASNNIITKIEALPGIKKAHIKDMLELASSYTQSQQRRRRPRIRKRDPNRVPRPMNCFLAYRLEKQKQIASICPGTNHREISKIVAKWWSEESDEEKEKYRLIAEKDKQLHKEKYPNYKYTPKKKRQVISNDNSSNDNKSSTSDNTVENYSEKITLPPLSIPKDYIGETTTIVNDCFIRDRQQQEKYNQGTPPFNSFNYSLDGFKSLYSTCRFGNNSPVDDQIILPPINVNHHTDNTYGNYNQFSLNNYLDNINNSSWTQQNLSSNTNNYDSVTSSLVSSNTFSYGNHSTSNLPNTGSFWAPVAPPPLIHSTQQHQQHQQTELPWIGNITPLSFQFSTSSTSDLLSTDNNSTTPSTFDIMQRQQSISAPQFLQQSATEQQQNQLLPSYYPTLPSLDQPIYQHQDITLTDMLNTDFPLMNSLFSPIQQTVAPSQTQLDTYTNDF
ncbi:hypothetical protein BDC45DRAFT_578115 [Circinella umbellata]|nr:hypothetical protein BDC45DRAFT_578115 [Circinella umbellata]